MLLNEAAGSTVQRDIKMRVQFHRIVHLTLLHIKYRKQGVFILFNSNQLLCVIANFIQPLLCVKYYSKCFTLIFSLSSHNNPEMFEILLNYRRDVMLYQVAFHFYK